MAIPFCKFHGFGNDYIVFERLSVPAGVPLNELARSMCDRKAGAGADGIAVLAASTDGISDYFCEILNPDGSTAGFSGNGTRCAAAYLFYKEKWSGPLRLGTLSGLKVYDLIERKGSGEFWFAGEIGEPSFASNDVPVILSDRREAVVNEPISACGREYYFSAVNVGNPVACLYVDDFNFDWRFVGASLETNEIFPERANIVFVKVLDRSNIEIRIWERGAGETAASGTCSSGAAVMSAFLLKTDRKVSVHSEGGTTEIDWRSDGQMVIRGRADLAYCGEWPT